MLWTAGLTVMSSVIFGLVPALAFTRDAHGSVAPREPRGIAHAAQPPPAARPRLVRGRAVDRAARRRGPDAAYLHQSSRRADRLRSRACRHRQDPAQPRGVHHGRSPVGVLSRRDRARARAARCRGGQRRRPTAAGAGPDHPARLAKRGSRADAFDRHAAEHHARLLRGDGDSAARGPRHLRRRHQSPPARRRRRRAAGGAVVERRGGRQTARGWSGEAAAGGGRSGRPDSRARRSAIPARR